MAGKRFAVATACVIGMALVGVELIALSYVSAPARAAASEPDCLVAPATAIPLPPPAIRPMPIPSFDAALSI